MTFQSEIRDSQINQLIEKVSKRSYGQYLVKIELTKARGFKNKSISFDFPVTALIGPNGGGKTTVLGATACAYKEVKPSRFFAKSGKYDDSMQNWSLEYELIDKKVNAKSSFTRTSSFKNLRWSRDSIAREVAIFGVSRTVPANERGEMRQCASNNFSRPAKNISVIEDAVAIATEKILGKDVTAYTSIKVDSSGKITLLTGKTSQDVHFSEFHFGAGESSIIRMVMEIESLPDGALILIEEIENGLHPIATIRMVEYLIEVAERKKSQIIFTTHSNDALVPLPAIAIWSAINNNLTQGKLDVRSLRAITGQIEADSVVFVEDNFARMWVQSIIATDSGIHHDEVEIHGMEGDGTAVIMNKFHNNNPAIDSKSICIIDGDSKQIESEKDYVYRLPGLAPEAYVYDKVLDIIDEVAGVLTVALHKPYEFHNKLKPILTAIKRTNRDAHLLFSQVGKELGFISEDVVKSAFLSTWASNYPLDVERLLIPIKAIVKSKIAS